MPIQKIIHQIENLIDIGIALSSEKDIAKLLEKIVLGAKSITHADGGSLFLTQDDVMSIEIFQSDSLGLFFNDCNSNFMDKPSVPLYAKNGEPNLRNVVSYSYHKDETVNIHDAYDAVHFDFVGPQELRIRTLPWVWFAFALFLIVYAGGFIEAQHFSEYFYTTAFAICLTLSYLIVFTEYNEPMRIKRLLTYITQENWQRAAEELPLWCVTFVLAAVVALPLSFAHPADIEELHVYPITILLFLLRDIGIFLFFSFGKNPQRAFSLTLLSFVLLYGVLPSIFAAADLKAVSALFFPLVADSMGISIICMGVQSALVWYVLYQRWQESV